MAYPTIYDVTYSYTGFQVSQGNNSFPGTQIDADLAGLEASINSLSTFVQTAIRSDKALNNGIVTYDSLSTSLQTAGLTPAAAWVTATAYAINFNVIQNSTLYRSLVAHTSGVFATDLAAGKWVLVTTLPVGAQGIQGVQGVQGIQGVVGNTGATGSGYGGTSATSLLIANSVTKVFITQAGLAYQVGGYVRASSAAGGANFMEGTVSAYAGTSLSIAVTSIGGSGTFADWTFASAGIPGSVGVGSIDTKTGAFTTGGGLVTDTNLISMVQCIPGGRLTLTPGTPVTTTDVVAGTTVALSPVSNGFGGLVPNFTGSIMRVQSFLSSATDAIGPTVTLGANWALNSQYDWFFAMDGVTPRLGSGPAWTAGAVAGSDILRGTGLLSTELELYNGVWVNKNPITLRYANGSTFAVAVRQATYLGTFRTVAAGQAEDSMAKRFLYNAHNQTQRVLKNVTESTASWPYTLTTVRQANAAGANQLDMIVGLAGSLIDIGVTATADVSAGGSFAGVGIGINSTTVNSAQEMQAGITANRDKASARYKGFPTIGRQFYPWLEFAGVASGTNYYYGTGGTYVQSGISGTILM